ncbi:MAG: hypothetical protein L3K14_03420 [Thermoplasmata archaeon]|nr:hypothetical protein [Thermoplasmata archaeon]
MKGLRGPPAVMQRPYLRAAEPAAWGRTRYSRLALALACTVAFLLFAAPSLFPPPAPAQGTPPRAAGPSPAIASSQQLQLGISASPGQICAYNASTCPAGAPTARVTMTAIAPSGGTLAWPAVQVAFVVETTLFDGVYDPSAGDPGTSCAAGGGGMPCEESNGVPFFVANAQKIANSIQAANPHTQVSFALVDYFATCNWDDCDGAEYHVDIPSFIPSYQFGAEVQGSFQANVLNGGWIYGDSDFSDNILHSSSITALFGTITGSGLDWSKNTHHVIVWMGSTAPRDPEYVQNYCVSPSTAFSPGSCYGATCEPAYTFSNGQSPNCEGWIASHDGNLTHSIAALARTAPQCTESIGGVCTIDTIDLYATPTDYLSKDWPKSPPAPPGGGPDGPLVQLDVARVLEAGCDLAAATGGTWDGPDWFTCPNGQAGTLLFEPHGPSGAPGTGTPNLNNPTLFDAFRRTGFGPVTQTQVASGTARPLFQFVAIGNIAIVPGSGLQAAAHCDRYGVLVSSCQVKPTVLHTNGLTYLGWNWSLNRTLNTMFVGDSWSASFNVFATGPPFTTVPVDACVTTYCTQAGSGAVFGQFTSASYLPADNVTTVTQSFPLASVQVELTPTPVPPGAAPPPPPPPPPAIPIGPAVPVPILTAIGIGNTVGVANVSLQATAAGFIAAGLMRVGIRNRPIALRIAAKSGAIQSKFDAALYSQEAPLGRWE